MGRDSARDALRRRLGELNTTRGRPATRGKKPSTGRPPGRPPKNLEDYGWEVVGRVGEGLGLWAKKGTAVPSVWRSQCNRYYGAVNWLR